MVMLVGTMGDVGLRQIDKLDFWSEVEVSAVSLSQYLFLFARPYVIEDKEEACRK